MEQGSDYQNTINKLFAVYEEKGFLREDEALEIMTANGLSLVEINRATDKLIDKGAIFSNVVTNKQLSLDDYDDSLLSVDDIDDNDRAQTDYESIFKEVLSIAPGQRMLIDYVRGILPPQLREWQKLIPQMRSGNVYAFNRLFDMYLRVVMKIALQMSRDDGVEIEDAIQEGTMGLIHALNRFDSGLHGNFGSYISLWVQQYIARSIADTSRLIRLPVHAFEVAGQMKRIFRKFDVEQGREPTCEELSHALGLSQDTIKILVMVTREIISLDVLLENEEEDFDIVDDSPTIDELLQTKDLRKQVWRALNTLTEKERDILTLRFGLVDGKPYTLEEVGAIFKVTRERVRQVEVKAVEKLRRHTTMKFLKDFKDSPC